MMKRVIFCSWIRWSTVTNLITWYNTYFSLSVRILFYLFQSPNSFLFPLFHFVSTYISSPSTAIHLYLTSPSTHTFSLLLPPSSLATLTYLTKQFGHSGWQYGQRCQQECVLWWLVGIPKRWKRYRWAWHKWNTITNNLLLTDMEAAKIWKKVYE